MQWCANTTHRFMNAKFLCAKGVSRSIAFVLPFLASKKHNFVFVLLGTMSAFDSLAFALLFIAFAQLYFASMFRNLVFQFQCVVSVQRCVVSPHLFFLFERQVLALWSRCIVLHHRRSEFVARFAALTICAVEANENMTLMEVPAVGVESHFARSGERLGLLCC